MRKRFTNKPLTHVVINATGTSTNTNGMSDGLRLADMTMRIMIVINHIIVRRLLYLLRNNSAPKYRYGNVTMTKNVLESKPKISVIARLSQKGSLKARGISATTLVRLVAINGLNLALIARAIESNPPWPSVRAWFAESVSNMVLLTAIPISAKKPIITKKLSGLFVKCSPAATPKKLNGIAVNISSGCSMDLNRKASKINITASSNGNAMSIVLNES